MQDPQAIESTLARYYFDPDLRIGVSYDFDDGRPRLFCYGHAWSEAWQLAEGETRDDFAGQDRLSAVGLGLSTQPFNHFEAAN